MLLNGSNAITFGVVAKLLALVKPDLAIITNNLNGLPNQPINTLQTVSNVHRFCNYNTAIEELHRKLSFLMDGKDGLS